MARRVVQAETPRAAYSGPPKPWREAEREFKMRDWRMKVTLPRIQCLEQDDGQAECS